MLEAFEITAEGRYLTGGRALLDLRGLGATRNLILLDGRRLPISSSSGVVDTNVLPTSVVRDVEVITGGASAVYGSDAVSDWPLLNVLLNCASGATWVSFHHGGGVGIGFSQHAGLVICCDGTPEAAKRIERVLWNDPATGVMRHADAGYEIALNCAQEKGLRLPGILER